MSRFEQLPAELRLQIYSLVFSARQQGFIHAVHYIYNATRPSHKVEGILLVNRTIYSEAQAYFYESREFTITLSGTLAKQPLTTTTREDVKRGLDALSAIIQSASSLRIDISGWHNGASTTLLRYIKHLLRTRKRLPTKLTVQFWDLPQYVQGHGPYCGTDCILLKAALRVAMSLPCAGSVQIQNCYDGFQRNVRSSPGLLPGLDIDTLTRWDFMSEMTRLESIDAEILDRIIEYYFSRNGDRSSADHTSIATLPWQVRNWKNGTALKEAKSRNLEAEVQSEVIEKSAQGTVTLGSLVDRLRNWRRSVGRHLRLTVAQNFN